jgi:hypothetical protein
MAQVRVVIAPNKIVISTPKPFYVDLDRLETLKNHRLLVDYQCELVRSRVRLTFYLKPSTKLPPITQLGQIARHLAKLTRNLTIYDPWRQEGPVNTQLAGELVLGALQKTPPSAY